MIVEAKSIEEIILKMKNNPSPNLLTIGVQKEPSFKGKIFYLVSKKQFKSTKRVKIEQLSELKKGLNLTK